MKKSSENKRTKSSVFRYLPPGYEPGEFDVLCGRGRRCYLHSGNEYFRAVVQSMIPKYKNATSKIEKGYILSAIVQKIRDRARIGGFIKKDDNGQWYEVGDFLAREKVSQAFRDVLSEKYKSSNAYKKMRREVEQTGQLFETYLQKRGITPESSTSSADTPVLDIAERKTVDMPSMQAIPAHTLTVETLSSMKQPSPTESLFGQLEKFFSRQSSSYINSYDDPFEPSPLPGPNPFARTGPNQGQSASYSNLYEESLPLQRIPGKDERSLHSCPNLPVVPMQIQPGQQRMNLNVTELLSLSSQQNQIFQL